MTFSKEYYAAKKEVAEIDKQLEGPQSELDKKEAEKKQLLKNVESLKCSQKQDKRTLDTNILNYMKDKIRMERNGEKFILIEEDPVIADHNEKYKVSIAEKNKKIKTVNDSIASLDGEITKLKGKISVLKEKRKKPEAIIEHEDAEYEEEIRLRVELRRLEEQYDSYSSNNSDGYLGESYSFSGSSYYSGSSAAEEAEKTRRTIEREAEETRRQMAREAERSRRAAEKAANEAKWADYRRQRDIEMKEFHEKQARDRMIDSRCRSCKVAYCGMRFNRSNVNCPNYRPK